MNRCIKKKYMRNINQKNIILLINKKIMINFQ